MRNPLMKRIPRELKDELGKYIVIFLFFVFMISAVSGFLVANDSAANSISKQKTELKEEDGNFELISEADFALSDTIQSAGVTLYNNFYKEEITDNIDSTLRVFKIRDSINLQTVLEGSLPQNDNEIAIDRVYANNNKLKTGDTLSVSGENYTISGLVALADYCTLFQRPSDMIFDSIKFGVAVTTNEGFDRLSNDRLHYSYSWMYDDIPANDTEAAEMSESLLEVLNQNATIISYIPAYANQSIIFIKNDMSGDNTMIKTFLFIVVIILSFVIAISISSTIDREAEVIGTLRASGYKKSELLMHYLIPSILVMMVGCLVGNILGYTVIKDFFTDVYLQSYELPLLTVRWNLQAFVSSTILPLILMIVINMIMIYRKLSLSPLKLIRHELTKKKKGKAFKLNTKIKFQKRFRIRILFQNIPNYIIILLGVFFANFLLLFGLLFQPMFKRYEKDIVDNLLCDYQYILKAPVEANDNSAERVTMYTVNNVYKDKEREETTVYGVDKDSKYIQEVKEDSILISSGYSIKYNVDIGDEITLREMYSDTEYTLTITGVYEYPSVISVFMNRSKANELFGFEEGYFNGYLSDVELNDMSDAYIQTVITEDTMTKTSRQMIKSMGSLAYILAFFGAAMFILIIYLLSKIVIEKNTTSISLTKILGYENSEINKLYVTTTSIVVILSLVVTLPICNIIMTKLIKMIMFTYSGNLTYSVDIINYLKIIILGVVSYIAVLYVQLKKIRQIPLSIVLKE